MNSTDLAATLRAGFSGQVLEPGQPGYDESRRIFNPMIDRRPALVARWASTADVVAAVTAARESELVVAVRCGGHSFAGISTCDDGMQIDLRGLNSITVDPQARTARAGGGAAWGPFDAATQAHGLHAPGGRVTTTGLGGFTTGGGYGWTWSKYGLACDNLVSAEVVLADGSVVRASETEHADLFWGIRGGSGNFGIVTEFELRLHPLGPVVLAGLTMFPIERAPEVMRAWRDWSDAAPDEVSTGCAVVTAPPEEFVPPELRGKPVFGMIALYVGDPRPEPARCGRSRTSAPPSTTSARCPTPSSRPPSRQRSTRSRRTAPSGSTPAGSTCPGSATARSRRSSPTPPIWSRSHPLSQMIIFRIGQGVAAVADEATAFSHRDASYLFHPITAWADPADDVGMTEATRAFAAAMRPFGTGASYLNFTHEADRVRAAYGDGKYRRLVALKDRYDPANLFRLNQNIRPSQQPAAPALA